MFYSSTLWDNSYKWRIYFAAVPCIPMQLVYNASFSPDGAAFEKPRILTCLPGHWFSVNKYSMVVTCDHNGTWQHLPLGCKGKTLLKEVLSLIPNNNNDTHEADFQWTIWLVIIEWRLIHSLT